MPDFSLRKWYLDAADNRGNVYIGYWVTFQWGKLKLNGWQSLWRSSEKGVVTQTTINRQSPPVFEGMKRLIWKPDKLEAIWESEEKPVGVTLVDTKEGKIAWHCTQPKARAIIKSPRLSFSGWGYTEYLDISIPLWKFPFKTLYWGRCHSNNHYIVWIRCEGKTRQNCIWFDGKCHEGFTIEDNKIAGPDFLLKLGENVPLRQGKIGSSIFESVGNVTRILPKTILSLDEHKWYNLGILETSTGAEPAIVIYEVVSW